MCGLAGLLRFDGASAEASLLESMGRLLKHRGPDDHGFLTWTGRGPVRTSRYFPSPDGSTLAFVHHRLSILDLSDAGRQPMSTPDGRFHLVYNGEIYNYLELREELKKLGHTFHSSGDSEVLLRAYAQWGKTALTRLVGMFAFVVLDTRERKLFLARDFFGIKPLYYASEQNYFAFASEIPALLQLPGVRRLANAQRIFTYLRAGVTDDGGETFFQQICQLPAAHYLEVDLDRARSAPPVRYWDIVLDKPREISSNEAATYLRDLFFENIKLHLRSDVQVGCALSGGIDSSSILSSIRRVLGKNAELHAFSYLADDQNLDEEAWINLAAEAARATVHKVTLEPDDLVSDLEPLIFAQGEPFGSTSIYAQYRVFRRAKGAGIKVMLDGQGADELLGGYHHYVAARVASLFRERRFGEGYALLCRASQLPGLSKMRILSRLGSLMLPENLQSVIGKWIGHNPLPSWVKHGWFKLPNARRYATHYIPEQRVLSHLLKRTLVQTTLPALLRFEDRNSMAFSVESRVPFLTPKLAEFVLSLPEELLISSEGLTKSVFRAAMRGIVPDKILDRREKIAFATPEAKWLTQIRNRLREILKSPCAASIPFLDVGGAESALNSSLLEHPASAPAIWRCINLVKWSEIFGVTFN